MYQDPESVLDDVRPQLAQQNALSGVIGPDPQAPGARDSWAKRIADRSRAAKQPKHGSVQSISADAGGSLGPATAPPLSAPAAAGSTGTAADRALAGAIQGPQGSQQPTGPDTSAWNTDQYAKPGFTASPTGGPLAGYDATKWADPNHQTPKYVAGRIMASHDNSTPEGRAAVIADLQKAYPGTTFNGKDKVSIPGVGNNIDIWRGAGAGVYEPQWLTEENQGGREPTAGAGSAFDGFQSNNRVDMGAIDSRNTQTGGDALQAIYQMLPGMFGDLGVQPNMDAINSRNQQTGGDALQSIYQLLPGLMGNA